MVKKRYLKKIHTTVQSKVDVKCFIFKYHLGWLTLHPCCYGNIVICFRHVNLIRLQLNNWIYIYQLFWECVADYRSTSILIFCICKLELLNPAWLCCSHSAALCSVPFITIYTDRGCPPAPPPPKALQMRFVCTLTSFCKLAIYVASTSSESEKHGDDTSAFMCFLKYVCSHFTSPVCVIFKSLHTPRIYTVTHLCSVCDAFKLASLSFTVELSVGSKPLLIF